MRAQRKQKQESSVEDSMSGRYQDILNKLEQHIKGPNEDVKTKKDNQDNFDQIKHALNEKANTTNNFNVPPEPMAPSPQKDDIIKTEEDEEEEMNPYHRKKQYELEEEKKTPFGFYKTTESSFARNISASHRYE